MIRSSRLGRWALGLLVLLAGSASVPAVDIMFDLRTLPTGVASASLTSAGYTLLFTSSVNNLTRVTGTYGGVYYDRDTFISIKETAGATDLIFKSYKTGAVDNLSGNSISFNLTGGTGTSNGNPFQFAATSNFNGSYLIGGSQVVTFNPINFGATNQDKGYIQSLTFSTVPEPSTYALAAIATGVMAALARRRKAARA